MTEPRNPRRAPSPVGINLQALVDGGGTVTISAPVTSRQVAVIRAHTTIVGDAEKRPVLRFFGSAENKGGFVVKGKNLTLRDLELWEASCSDGNGAGVRFEAADGVASNISAHNVAFRCCENGLLGPDNTVAGGRVELKGCEFDRCGRLDSGQEHGIYMGRLDLLSVSDCYFHDTYIGHELKSRARKNVITDSRFGSVTSTCSYEIEFPEGGDVTIERCTFIQSPTTDNDFLLGYGAEWKPEIGAPTNRLIVRDSVFWNFRESGYIAKINPAVSNTLVEFHNCTFINFVNTYDEKLRPEAIAALGSGNRILSLAQGYENYPDGPKLTVRTPPATITAANMENAQSLEPRTWNQIEGTTLIKSLTIPEGQSEGNLRAVIDAWGGAVHAGKLHYFYGTGHGDGIINAWATFDTSTYKWSWATPQSSAAVIDRVSPYEATLLKDNTEVKNQYSDGYPSAIHGWGNGFRLPSGDVGTLHWGFSARVWRVQAKRWDYIALPYTSAVRYSQLVQIDSVRNRLFAIPQYFTLEVLNADTFQRETTIELKYSPTHATRVGREIWYFCGTHGTDLIRLDMDTLSATYHQLQYPLDHKGYALVSGTACAYDPIFGILRFDVLGNIWSVDPTTLTCERFSTKTTNPIATNGWWYRVWSEGDLLYAVASGRENVYVLRA